MGGLGSDMHEYMFHDGQLVISVHASIAQMQMPVPVFSLCGSKPIVVYQLPAPTQRESPYARAWHSSFVSRSEGPTWAKTVQYAPACSSVSVQSSGGAGGGDGGGGEGGGEGGGGLGGGDGGGDGGADGGSQKNEALVPQKSSPNVSKLQSHVCPDAPLA